MNGNHWTVFNSSGAAVADGLNLDGVMAYMTEERFARGWTAVHCLVVKSMGDLPEAQDEPSGETVAQRNEVCDAWAALPAHWTSHPAMQRLYRALGGINRAAAPTGERT